jgi:hypothetical protein
MKKIIKGDFRDYLQEKKVEITRYIIPDSRHWLYIALYLVALTANLGYDVNVSTLPVRVLMTVTLPAVQMRKEALKVWQLNYSRWLTAFW